MYKASVFISRQLNTVSGNLRLLSLNVSKALIATTNISSLPECLTTFYGSIHKTEFPVPSLFSSQISFAGSIIQAPSTMNL